MDAVRNGTTPRLLGPDGKPIPPDNPAVEHVHTFSSLINIASRSYSYRWDESYSYSRADALAMRRDCGLMALLRERQFPSAQMPWHLESEDPKDVFQQATADELTHYIRAGFADLESFLMVLLEALWYGRYAAQMLWRNSTVNGQPAFLPIDFEPVNGDKLQFGWDGTPELMIYPPAAKDYPPDWIKHADRSPLLWLGDPSVRDRFVIHKHDVIDADYYEADKAGGRHGVGIRHWVYWTDWLKREITSWLMDYMERTGLGLTIFYYDQGNPQSEKEAVKAAQEHGRNTVIVWPRGTAGANTGAGIERQETSTAGCELIMRVMEYFDDKIERFVVGQSMSSGSDGEGSLGGSGRAMFAADTKNRIIRSDCGRLGATLTRDLVRPLVRWNRPDVTFRLRWVFDVDKPDPDKKMEAAKTLFDMGGDIKTAEVYPLAGLSEPTASDKVLKKQSPTPPGMPGAGGAPPFGKDGEEESDDGESGDKPPKPPPRIPNPANVQPSRNERDGDPERYEFREYDHQRAECGPVAAAGAAMKAAHPDPGEGPTYLAEPSGPKKVAGDPALQAALVDRDDSPGRHAKDAAGHEHKGAGPGGGQFTAGGNGGTRQPIRPKTDRSVTDTAKRTARRLSHTAAEHLHPKHILANLKAAVAKAREAPHAAAHPAETARKAWEAVKDKYQALEARYGRTATLVMAGAYLGSWGLWAMSPGLAAVVAPEPSAQLIGIAEGILALRKAHKARKRLKNVQALRGQPAKHAKDAQGHEHKGPGEGGGQFTSGGSGGGGDNGGMRKQTQFKVKPPKKLYRGITADGRGAGVYSLGKGLYSTPTKAFLKGFAYDKVVELTPEEAFPRNPLVLRQASELTDWLLRESGMRNIREFNAKYGDPGEFVQSKGFDGVWAGDEVVRYFPKKAEG